MNVFILLLVVVFICFFASFVVLRFADTRMEYALFVLSLLASLLMFYADVVYIGVPLYKNTEEPVVEETQYQIVYHPAEVIGYDAVEKVENTLFQTVDDEIVYTVYGYYDYDAYLLGIAEDKVVIVYKVCEGALG